MTNPLNAFLQNLLKDPTKTVTAILSAITIILMQFDIVVPPEYQATVTTIAATIATVIILFQGTFKTDINKE